jgi:cytochrome P450
VVIADMFAESTESFRWNHRFSTLSQWVGAKSLLTSDGAAHRRRRQAVQDGFTRRRVNSWIPSMLEAIDASVDGLLDSLGTTEQVVDMYPVGRSLVLDIILLVLGGPRMLDRAELIDAQMQVVQDFIELPAVKQIPHPWPGGARRGVRRARSTLDMVTDEEMARVRSGNDGHGSSVIESLVFAGVLDDAEIRDQVVTLIGAGYDPPSASLAWILLRAASTPGLWDALGDEADATLGDPGGTTPVDPSVVGSLRLVDRTVRESLRLHPPGAFGAREAADDLVLGGYLIPRRTLIAWSTHLSGRDPGFWPDPLRFDPDRHLNPSPEQAALSRLAWVPFGGGARNCLGLALAHVELNLIVARFAQRLRLQPVRSTVPPPTRRSRPQGGAPLRVSER